MSGVGRHFSIEDLIAVRGIALDGGWSFGAGLLFGLALSVAGTVVVLRALEERSLLDSDKGRIPVGRLIVEDLATAQTPASLEVPAAFSATVRHSASRPS